MSAALVGWGLLALAVVAAGVLGLSLARAMRPAAYGLSTGEARVYSAYIEALLSTVEWHADLDTVLRDVAAFVEPAPGNIRLPVQLGMWSFQRVPLLVGVSVRAFARLPIERRLEVIHRASKSSSILVNAMWEPTHAMVLACLSAQPAALRLCKVDRAERVAQCRAARDSQVREIAS